MASGQHYRLPKVDSTTPGNSGSAGFMWDESCEALKLAVVVAGQVLGCEEGVTVCKTVGSAYVGSNPTPATTCGNGPLAANSRAGGPFLLGPSVCHLVAL
jgi:hypothetical protein